MVVENDNMILFWMPDSIYSNWYLDTPLTLPAYPEIRFENSEAAFMYLKAKTFGDTVIADMVIANQDPKHVKGLGKRVTGFKEEIWAEHRYDCMLDVVFAKFSQNPELRKALLATGNKILVEASPVDKIWGIGLSPTDLRALDQKQWRGLNLLGEVLMDVRHILQQLEEQRHDNQLR